MTDINRHTTRLRTDAAGAGPTRHDKRLRRRAGDEQGTVIVIVAILLTLFLAAGALAIDLSSARGSEQRAQTAADAAATAAASTLADGGTIADASHTATTIAQANGIPQGDVTVSFSPVTPNQVVTVAIRSDVNTSLGKELGRDSIPVAARAVASVNSHIVTTTGSGTSVQTSTVVNSRTGTVTNTSTGTVTSMTCATAGNGCLAVYAAQTGCGNSIVFGGGVHVTGGVWSNGGIDLGGGGSSWGPVTYAPGCAASASGGNYTFTPSADNPQAQPTLPPWPVPYANDFPNCSGSTCTGPCANGAATCASAMHTPSFCTQADDGSSWELDGFRPITLVTHQIYCAVGTGAPNQPATWTGSLLINGGKGTVQSSFVAGSITLGGGTKLIACGYTATGYQAAGCSASVPVPSTGNYPIMYAVNGPIDGSSGGMEFSGDWYAPRGLLTVGGGTAETGFLEGQTVNWSDGGIKGDGPPFSGGLVGITSTTYSTSTTVTTSTSTSTSYSTSTFPTVGTTISTSGSKLTG